MSSARLPVAFLLLLVAAASSDRDERKERHKHTAHAQDPLALLDRHVSLALAHDGGALIPQLARQYFWPWTELARAVAALDGEEALEEPLVRADPRRFEVRIDVRSYRPDEVRVRVRQRAVVVEGAHGASRFVQRYALPPGCEPDAVTARLRADGVLVVSAPRRPRPPPPPEREVPVELDAAAAAAGATSDSEDLPMEQRPAPETERAPPTTEGAAPAAEATTHVGKIRKKELKNDTKTRKNETKKPVEDNELDYANLELE